MFWPVTPTAAFKLVPKNNYTTFVNKLVKLAFGKKMDLHEAYAIYMFLFKLLDKYVELELVCHEGYSGSFLANNTKEKREFLHFVKETWKDIVATGVTAAKFKASHAYFKSASTDTVDLDHVFAACFMDHIYDVLITKSVLDSVVVKTDNQLDIRAALDMTLSQLFSEYNIPLSAPADGPAWYDRIESPTKTKATSPMFSASAAAAVAASASASASKSVRAKVAKAAKVAKVAKPKVAKVAKPKVAKVAKAATPKVAKAAKPAKPVKPKATKSASPSSASASSVDELRKKASVCNIAGRSKMRKAELIVALQGCK